MNVTDKEYEKLTDEGRKLYDSLANYFLFESNMPELDNISYQDKISSLASDYDTTVLRDYLFSRTESNI